jgi:hypothetical protein
MTRIEMLIEEARVKGIARISTCNAPNWNRDEHDGMLILQHNTPSDLCLTVSKSYGVCDWALIKQAKSPESNLDKAKAIVTAVVNKDWDNQIVQDGDFLGTRKELKEQKAMADVISSWTGLRKDPNFKPDNFDPDSQMVADIEGCMEEWARIKDKEFRDAERPETAQERDDKQNLRVFQAYQHFLYYIDTDHMKKSDPWGGRMTDHFLGKLRDREIKTIVSWVQEMSSGNQALLLDYIMANHSNKW